MNKKQYITLTIDRDAHEKLQKISKEEFRSMLSEMGFLINSRMKELSQKEPMVISA
jgi:hypothetical protein